MAKEIKKGLNVSNRFITSIIKHNNQLSLKILFYSLIHGKVEKKPNMSILSINMRQLQKDLHLDFKNMRQNIQKIQKTLITIHENENVCDLTLIPKAFYKISNQTLELNVFNSVLDELYEIKNKYTPIDIYNIIKLQNKHSIRFITILEMIDNYDEFIAKKKSFTKEELNKIFGTKYRGVKEIERAIIKPIQEELDELSNLTFIYDLDFDIDKLTKGRKPLIGITIYLKENKQRQLKMF